MKNTITILLFGFSFFITLVTLVSQPTLGNNLEFDPHALDQQQNATIDNTIKLDLNTKGGEYRLIRSDFKLWRNDLNIWGDLNWQDYTYNNDGKLSSYIDRDKVRENRKVVFEYDNQGLLIKEDRQVKRWKGNTSYWETEWLYTYEYNVDGKVIQRLKRRLMDSVLVNRYLRFYSYDVNHNNIKERLQRWNSVDSTWFFTDKFKTSYDSNDVIIRRQFSTYNRRDSTWHGDSESQYFYDNNILVKIVSNDYTNLKGRTLIKYDANQNDTIIIYQTREGREWVNRRKNKKVYDTEDNLVFESRQNWKDSMWLNYWERNLYYEMITRQNDIELPNSDLLIYPNPSDGLFDIELKNEALLGGQISVFDIRGKRVFFEKNILLNKKRSFNLSLLSSGSYHLVFTNNESFITKKIVIINEQ